MASKREDVNYAKKLSKEERKKVGRQICEDYDLDIRGRKSWEDRRKRFYKLWMTEREPKNYPFPNASNVCLPILAIACNQFHARSYQAMFTPPDILKTMPVGPADIKRSKSCAGLMNWQIQNDIPNYEENHDKLLLGVPINGMGNTKSTWDFENERPNVEYVSAMDLVLPYRTTYLETARRYTHKIRLHYDELELRAAKKGKYIDFDRVQRAGTFEEEPGLEEIQDKNDTQTHDQDQKPHLILEQYRYWKFKWDDKMIPYTFTVDYDSKTLLRVTDRLITHGKDQYVFNPFTDYSFFPNIEGYYAFGFGHFLEQLNEMANTAFNQIFDSGRLSNQPFGFYGRRSGLRKKEIRLWPGKMEEVDDASQVYFPQMQRVDQVLFQVLGLIETYTQQFTSTGDYLLGRESRGTKTPTASGTMAIIEQGLVMYSIMIKRQFRSLKREFQKLYLLNQQALPEKKQYVILENSDLAFPTAKRKDFDGKMHIIPIGDPTYASKLLRRQEANELIMGMMQNPLVMQGKAPPIQPKIVNEAYKIWLETFDKREYMKLLPTLPEPDCDPETENAMIYQGDEVHPKEHYDIPAHLEVHERFKKSQLMKDAEPEVKAALDKLIKEEKAMFAKVSMAQQEFGAKLPSPSGPGGAPPEDGQEPDMNGPRPGMIVNPEQEESIEEGPQGGLPPGGELGVA